MDSKACKTLIAEFCKSHAPYIQNQFIEAVYSIDASPSFKVSNWKRISKYKEKDGTTTRIFNCVPFDDQLRGYVYTDKDDNLITFTVVGE